MDLSRLTWASNLEVLESSRFWVDFGLVLSQFSVFFGFHLGFGVGFGGFFMSPVISQYRLRSVLRSVEP